MADVECGYEAMRRAKILGGTEALVGEFPWLVSIRGYDGSHICGGFIIHKRYIITAAHCVNR